MTAGGPKLAAEAAVVAADEVNVRNAPPVSKVTAPPVSKVKRRCFPLLYVVALVAVLCVAYLYVVGVAHHGPAPAVADRLLQVAPPTSVRRCKLNHQTPS